MRFIIAILVSLTSLSAVAASQVICNNFQMTAGRAGDQIHISLATDLPESARVTIEVTRRYWRKGQNRSYTLDYHAADHGVTELKAGLKVDISNAAAAKALEIINAQAEFAGRSPVEIKEMAPSFKVKASLTMSQTDPKFGPYNKKLEGSAVRQIDEYRGCKQIVHIELNASEAERKKAEAKPTQVKPRDFEEGKVYVLRRGLNLKDHPQAFKDLGAVMTMEQVPETALIYIDQKLEIDDWPWFRIAAAAAADQAPSSFGWVRLDDFDIKKHTEVPAPLLIEKLEESGFAAEKPDQVKWRLRGALKLDERFGRQRVVRGVIELDDGLKKEEAEAQARAAVWELMEKGIAKAAILEIKRAGDESTVSGEAWVLPKSTKVPEALDKESLDSYDGTPCHTHAHVTEAYFKERPKAMAVGAEVSLKEEGSFEVNLWTDPAKIGGEKNARIAAGSYAKIKAVRYIDSEGKLVVRYEVEDENGRTGWVEAKVVTPY